MWNQADKIFYFFLNILFPQRCIICGRETKYLVCNRCVDSIKIYKGYRCPLCSKPLQNDKNLVCATCLLRKNYFNKGFSLFSYEDERIKILIKYLKFYHKPQVVRFLIYFSDFIKELDIFKGCDCLIPIPMHPKDIKERGYNQTAYIAKIISKITKIPVRFNILVKAKRTKKQVGLSQQERLKNLTKAFKVLKKPKDINRVVLIDDVFTTGSTINECAKVLKQYDIESYFFTIAIVSGVDT